MFASAAMIAFQIAGKATRDALFLSNHPATSLPAMVMAAAIFSLLLAALASRAGSRLEPAVAVPRGFALSAALILVEWTLVERYPGPVSVLLYLHFSGLGVLLVSGFWSIVSERFDPRTAKRHIARIGVGGTIGGLLGGVMAERTATLLPIEALFPMLAGLHLTAAFLTRRMGRTGISPQTAEFNEESPAPRSGLEVLRSSPYLTTIGAIVFLTAMSEGLLDLAFKAWASLEYADGPGLLRFFAMFYTGAALLTVLVQSAATRRVLQRFGLAASVASLPTVVALGAGGAMLVPGLLSMLIARASESVVRNSLYRSAYELLFNPVPIPDKRVIKPVIDVGVVRTADLAAGALAQVVILFAAFGQRGLPLLIPTFLFALTAMFVARALHRGYMRTLERSLVVRGSYLNAEPQDLAQTGILQTLGAVDLTQLRQEMTLPAETIDDEHGARPETPPAGPVDPLVERIVELRSKSRTRVRAALKDQPIPLALVPHIVPLLAWDDVARDVVRALRPVAGPATGILTDYLLDGASDFSIRRRLPLVLVECATQRAADGLLRGLEDRRFEVRYRCGHVLSRLRNAEPSLEIDRDQVLQVIDREVAVDRGVWESRRLLDATEAEETSPVLDDALRDRADRSLEHVFTMLSLILPAQPLRVAYRGLFTQDALLRGTALEYLESALPEELRRKLWPFLETPLKPARQSRSADDALGGLLKSEESIADRLDALKRLREDSTD
jgi:hypothetical protein